MHYLEDDTLSTDAKVLMATVVVFYGDAITPNDYDGITATGGLSNSNIKRAMDELITKGYVTKKESAGAMWYEAHIHGREE